MSDCIRDCYGFTLLGDITTISIWILSSNVLTLMNLYVIKLEEKLIINYFNTKFTINTDCTCSVKRQINYN